MELTDHVHVAFFNLLLGFFVFFSVHTVEPVVKHFGVRKYFWEKEVQQTPEFMEIVLERGSSEEELALSIEFPDNL